MSIINILLESIFSVAFIAIIIAAIIWISFLKFNNPKIKSAKSVKLPFNSVKNLMENDLDDFQINYDNNSFTFENEGNHYNVNLSFKDFIKYKLFYYKRTVLHEDTASTFLVVYYWQKKDLGGFGNIDISLKNSIPTVDDIRNTENEILAKYDYDGVVILNWHKIFAPTETSSTDSSPTL